MRTAAWGLVAGALSGLAAWWMCGPISPVVAQRPAAWGADRDAGVGLITHQLVTPEGRTLLTVVDASTRVVGVYAIDPATGEITLRSVRNIRFDLQMDEFNGVSPTPREIRALLGQR